MTIQELAGYEKPLRCEIGRMIAKGKLNGPYMGLPMEFVVPLRGVARTLRYNRVAISTVTMNLLGAVAYELRPRIYTSADRPDANNKNLRACETIGSIASAHIGRVTDDVIPTPSLPLPEEIFEDLDAFAKSDGEMDEYARRYLRYLVHKQKEAYEASQKDSVPHAVPSPEEVASEQAIQAQMHFFQQQALRSIRDSHRSVSVQKDRPDAPKLLLSIVA